MILRLRVFWPTNVRSQIFSVIPQIGRRFVARATSLRYVRVKKICK